MFRSMKTLAIETSSAAGNVCLSDGEEILQERYLGDGMIHGRELIPAIRDIMKEQGWSPTDLEIIAVSKGPGSFTGLRVGLAAAKTLAMTCGARLVGVPTLDVMARNVPDEAEFICPMTDVRRKEVGACLFQRDGDDLRASWECRTCSPAELCDTLPNGAWLLGDGLKAHEEVFSSREDFRKLEENAWHAQAKWVARLGFRECLAGRFSDPHSLVPIYLRLPTVMEKMANAAAKSL
ncbi:MAG: tRNA (adenosine(37)-N6)-threonylcarbamoyltransferase complex dimerization subunit type 1 TsaB [Planctomycetota bacterium]|nr:tRNA (adenosine(37)-N6)-threonylcarbamoyltransferase complex dimerization subunit type 1 TsaB [Planctomycetota bacterium]